MISIDAAQTRYDLEMRPSARRITRWIPAAVLAVVLPVCWGLLLFGGGMTAVVAWVSLISVGQLLGPLAILAVLVHAVRRRRFSRPMQAALGLALFSLWPALWGFRLLTITYPTSKENTKPAATIRVPADGPVRVGWGGDRVGVNYHAFTPDQRWAYDLLIEPAGVGSRRLEDYGCFGKPVLAPARARVHLAENGEPDQTPGEAKMNFEKPIGNMVALALDTGTFVLIAHMKHGSVTVREGEQVEEGQPIGACGNSGVTSEPHIHIHHQRQDPRNRPLNFSEGLPLHFRDHDGAPPMPEGGLGAGPDGKPILKGAIIRHVGRR